MPKRDGAAGVCRMLAASRSEILGKCCIMLISHRPAWRGPAAPAMGTRRHDFEVIQIVTPATGAPAAMINRASINIADNAVSNQISTYLWRRVDRRIFKCLTARCAVFRLNM